MKCGYCNKEITEPIVTLKIKGLEELAYCNARCLIFMAKRFITLETWENIIKNKDEKKTPSQRIYKDSSSFQEVATLEEGSAYTSLAIKINTIANILDEHEEKLRKYKYI